MKRLTRVGAWEVWGDADETVLVSPDGSPYHVKDVDEALALMEAKKREARL